VAVVLVAAADPGLEEEVPGPGLGEEEVPAQAPQPL
jgi:hypothetical protein